MPTRVFRRLRWGTSMKSIVSLVLVVLGFAVIAAGVQVSAASSNTSASPTYNITTLAGKVASIRATQGFYLRTSALIEQEADSLEVGASQPYSPTAITPTYVLSSPLDGTSVLSPAVVVNQDPNAASQNEPALAFDSAGHVFYAGLGFDRIAPPNTVAVNKGTFDSEGTLSWGAPTFINPTTSPSTLNDKEWIGVDSHAGSPFQDRVYVSWTRFVFNPINGRYVQSPIAFVYSKDGGATFSNPQLIVSNVLYDQGSRIVVGADGTVYVFWEGSTRLAAFNSIYMVASSDGGVSFSAPVAVAPAVDIVRAFNTVFRVNSFPAADIAPDGTLYVSWSSEVLNSATTYGADPTCAYFYSGTASVYANCHSSAVWSSSTDRGATWSNPVPILTAFDASNRVAIGYPVTQANGNVLNAPAARRVDSFWPAVAASPSGKVFMSAYAADVVSPWQTCATPAPPTAVGRINCLALGPYVHNARLDYVVANAITGTTQTVTTHPVNTRYHFGGGFIGDYTDLAVGSDDMFHAVWTDTNQQQSVTWWYGFEFVPTTVHQQDIVTASGTL